jgi:hypothetical protein
MKIIKLELSVKLLLFAIALGLFLNFMKDYPPKANADISGLSISTYTNNEIFVDAVRKIVAKRCYVRGGGANRISC